LEEAANTMVNTLREHIDEGSMPLKEIVFVGFSGNSADAFQRSVERILSRPKSLDAFSSLTSVYRLVNFMRFSTMSVFIFLDLKSDSLK
jgi:hypothetical protein